MLTYCVAYYFLCVRVKKQIINYSIVLYCVYSPHIGEDQVLRIENEGQEGAHQAIG